MPGGVCSGISHPHGKRVGGGGHDENLPYSGGGEYYAHRPSDSVGGEGCLLNNVLGGCVIDHQVDEVGTPLGGPGDGAEEGVCRGSDGYTPVTSLRNRKNALTSQPRQPSASPIFLMDNKSGHNGEEIEVE